MKVFSISTTILFFVSSLHDLILVLFVDLIRLLPSVTFDPAVKYCLHFSQIFWPTEAVSGASVKPSTDLQVEGTTVNLTCEASGSIFTRKWMKDGLDLTPSDSITLSEDSKVLTFKSVNREYAGIYLCKISNPISTAEASYSMVVNCK